MPTDPIYTWLLGLVNACLAASIIGLVKGMLSMNNDIVKLKEKVEQQEKEVKEHEGLLKQIMPTLAGMAENLKEIRAAIDRRYPHQ